jgi:hypothetical protein
VGPSAAGRLNDEHHVFSIPPVRALLKADGPALGLPGPVDETQYFAFPYGEHNRFLPRSTIERCRWHRRNRQRPQTNSAQ